MSDKRVRRVSELLKQEISQIIRHEVKDPRIGFVSVTDVEVSGDLKHAKVFVSVYGSDKEKEETMKGLNKAQGFIRSLVGDRLTTYHTPEVIFRYDDSIEHGVYMSKLISEVREEDKKKKHNKDENNAQQKENSQSDQPTEDKE
ncbi:MAG: 30S ribosome-binding factor RbfA [Halanaerobiaceae bacterium]